MKPFLSLKTGQVFFELDCLAEDQELAKAIEDCVKAQKNAAAETLRMIFKPHPDPERDVSPAVLEEILQSNKDPSGSRTEQITNAIMFNDSRYPNAVLGEEIAVTRKRVDKMIAEKIKKIFQEGRKLNVQCSAFLLYPPSGYMSWHTNWDNPAWRLYINYAEEPGKSFFRYRNPDTGEIITSVDKKINFRLFRALRDKPLWHAIYSGTYRYSLGYKMTKADGFLRRLKRKLLTSLAHDKRN